MSDFWVVRQGEDPWKVAPGVGDILSKHVGDMISKHPCKCLLCDDVRKIGALIALRAPDDGITTIGICADCARHEDKKLVEMAHQKMFPEVYALLDELEAKGHIETVEIDGLKGRRLTAKGQGWLEDNEKRQKD